MLNSFQHPVGIVGCMFTRHAEFISASNRNRRIPVILNLFQDLGITTSKIDVGVLPHPPIVHDDFYLTKKKKKKIYRNNSERNSAMTEGPTVLPEDIDWEEPSPVMPSPPAEAPNGIQDDEFALNLKPGLGLIDVTGTNWTTTVGEKKFVTNAGDVLAANLQKKYLFMNGQALVTDSRGKVYLGDASNQQLIQYLREKGYTELSENPDGVSLYVPQATDRKQV